MTAVTPTDRPKSVRNSCVIKVFGGVFMLSSCFLDCSVGVRVFVTGQSQISSFFFLRCHFEINLSLSHFNFYLQLVPELFISMDLLSFEYPSVLQFCL